MKDYLNCYFVVEGKTDVSRLSSLINTNFIITNGSEISKETLESIKTLSLTNEIIVFTDPDTPGKRIRDIVNNYVPNCKNAYVRKENSIKKNKVGVAEATDEEIMLALKNIHESQGFSSIYSLQMFQNEEYKICNSQEFRNFVTNKLHLDNCNSKRFIKRLNSINLPIEEFNKLVEEFKNGK